MTISKELFLAILSMDAYNRGYGAGIADGGEGDTDGLGDSHGTQIGTATVDQASDSDPLSAEFAAGFYAVAYDTPYGTVISYRGTDNPALRADPIKGGSDIINGWVAGAGEATSQTQMAIDFYRSVFGLNDPGVSLYSCGPQSGIVTGHSLGGGLAAYP